MSKKYVCALFMLFCILTLTCAYASEDQGTSDHSVSVSTASHAQDSTNLREVKVSSKSDKSVAKQSVSSSSDVKSDSSDASGNVVSVDSSSEVESDVSNFESYNNSENSLDSDTTDVDSFNIVDLDDSDLKVSEVSSISLLKKDGSKDTKGSTSYYSDELNITDYDVSFIPNENSINISVSTEDVNYADDKTAFNFSDLDLSVIPSSKPQTLNLSILLSSLNLTNKNKELQKKESLNLSDLEVYFLPTADSSRLNLTIRIPEFRYTDHKKTKFVFKDLDLNIMPNLKKSDLDISVLMSSLKLINKKENAVNLTNLKLGISTSGKNSSKLNLSIYMDGLKYADSNKTKIKMDGVNFTLIPSSGSDYNSSIVISDLNYTGKNQNGSDLTGFNLSGLNFTDINTTGINLSGADLSKFISSFNTSNIDINKIFTNMFNQSNYEYQIPSIYKNGFNLSDLSKYGVDLSKINFTKMMDGFNLTGIDFSKMGDGFDLSNFNLSKIFTGFNLSDADFTKMMSDMNMSGFNMSGGFDLSKLNMSNMNLSDYDLSHFITDMDLSSMNLTDMFAGFNLGEMDFSNMMNNFNLEELFKVFFKTAPTSNANKVVAVGDNKIVRASSQSVSNSKVFTVKRLSDNKFICNNMFTLEALNKLFDVDLMNGHLIVYIDGEKVFEGDVNGDLSKVLFEIVEKYLGEHEVKVEFTGSDGETKTFTEKITVE